MANAWVSIRDTSDRAQHWQAVFGRLDRVPVTGWLPMQAWLPGFNDPQLFYMMDLAKITAEERERLVANLAERFGLPVAEVAATLDQHGVPILASDVTFMTTDPVHLVMADDLVDDDEDPYEFEHRERDWIDDDESDF